METFEQPKITGYRQLTEDDATLINEIKSMASKVGDLCAKLQNDRGPNQIDQRWVAIGTTHLQQGFMALVRSVAKPTTF